MNAIAKRLRETHTYDRETGQFERRLKNVRRGKMPGSLTWNGYLVICIDQMDYRAHRLAWLYCYGRWPKCHLDHRNGIKSDNRIANLRPATKSQNGFNRGKTMANSSGFKGVTLDKRRGVWRAQIGYNRKNLFLGDFHSPQAAAEAYAAKEKELFGEFARCA